MNPGYALVSPYGIPASLRARKVANIGDGFIVRAIERLLSPRVATLRCSPRMTPAASMLARLQQTVIDNGNVFEVLMQAVRCCSLGQITNALFEVGGQYRRSM